MMANPAASLRGAIPDYSNQMSGSRKKKSREEIKLTDYPTVLMYQESYTYVENLL